MPDISEAKTRKEAEFSSKNEEPSNFIYDLVDEDIRSGRVSKAP